MTEHPREYHWTIEVHEPSWWRRKWLATATLMSITEHMTMHGDVRGPTFTHRDITRHAAVQGATSKAHEYVQQQHARRADRRAATEHVTITAPMGRS